jgi:hypothetical protein
MKNLLVYYRIVSYVLIVIAGLLGLVDLFSLVVALSNPFLLLSVFILTGVIIYSFTSFSFLLKGIQGGRQCKPTLKDWIKVNAYVSVAFGLLVLVQNISFFSNPANMTDVLKQVNDMQGKLKTPGVSTQAVIGTLKGVLYFMIVYALLLLSHVFITLRLVRDYGRVFGEKAEQD